MVDIITGYRTTKNILQDRREIDMSKAITMLDPDRTPFVVVLEKLSKSVTVNPEFFWMEDEYMPKSDKINKVGGYLSTDTSIVVDHAGYFTVGANVKVPRTGEVFKVTARVIATNTLTISRAVGSTYAAAALLNDDDLIILASSYPEGAVSRDPSTTKKTKDYNYTQIMRWPFSATRTNDQSKLIGGSDRAVERNKAGVEFQEYIEHQFLFGSRYEDTSGAEPERQTGGIYEFLNSNITSVPGGILTEPIWEAWLRDNLFLHGSSDKIVICSPLILSIINMFAGPKITKSEKDKSLGINISEYVSAHGTVKLMKSKTLSGDIYGGDCIGLDFVEDLIEMRYLQDVILKTNIQANDADGWKDEYLAEIGLQFKARGRHAILSGAEG